LTITTPDSKHSSFLSLAKSPNRNKNQLLINQFQRCCNQQTPSAKIRTSYLR